MWGGKDGNVELFWKKCFFLETVPRDTKSKILSTLTIFFSRSNNLIPESQQLMSQNNCTKRKTFCLKTVIWTRKKQLCKPCHKSFTKLSKSFSRQLRKLYTKESLVKELYSNKTFSGHLMFSYGVFVDSLTKFRINFVSKFNNGGTRDFSFKKTWFSKKCFQDTSNTVLANLWKFFTSIFRYSSSKTPKTKIDSNPLFFWKINMLLLIESIWTRRIQLRKPCRNF